MNHCTDGPPFSQNWSVAPHVDLKQLLPRRHLAPVLQMCRVDGEKTIKHDYNDQIETAETYSYYMYIYIRTRNIYIERYACA